MGQLSCLVETNLTIFRIKMIVKANCLIHVLMFFTSQCVTSSDFSNIENNGPLHDFGARIDVLLEALLKENRNMKNQMEVMQRTIEYQERLLKDHTRSIEYVNKSLKANNKYRHDDSDVIFAANIHLGSEYFLPLGTVSSYNQVVINVGNHFDGYMGIFFAPHSGVYEFWMDGLVVRKKHARAQLRVNGESIKEFSAVVHGSGYSGDFFGIHGNVVINLSAYDEVEIFIPTPNDSSNQGAISGYDDHYFMFAGRSL